MKQSSSEQAEPRYGWVMVGLAVVYLGVGNGTINAISVFLIPLNKSMGWARGDISFAYMVATVCAGLGGLVMG